MKKSVREWVERGEWELEAARQTTVTLECRRPTAPARNATATSLARWQKALGHLAYHRIGRVVKVAHVVFDALTQ